MLEFNLLYYGSLRTLRSTARVAVVEEQGRDHSNLMSSTVIDPGRLSSLLATTPATTTTRTSFVAHGGRFRV